MGWNVNMLTGVAASVPSQKGLAALLEGAEDLRTIDNYCLTVSTAQLAVRGLKLKEYLKHK